MTPKRAPGSAAAGIPYEGVDCTPEEAVEAVKAVRASTPPVVPLTPAIRRQLLIDAATEMLLAEPFGPVMTPVIARLAALGVDVVNDSAHMIAMSVLSQSLQYGLEPSAAALAKLGAA